MIRTKVIITKRLEWNYVDLEMLLVRYKQDWQDFCSNNDILEGDELAEYDYRDFVNELIQIYGADIILGNQPDGDEIEELDIYIVDFPDQLKIL